MQQDQSHQPLAGEATVAGPQAASAVTPRKSPLVAPNVLDSEQEALLGAVLNRLIPEADGMPGAGDLGIIATIDRTLAAYPPLRRLFCDGLVAIEVESGRQCQSGFAGLDGNRQDAVLRAVELDFPAFFAALIDHTYRGYYTHPHVYQAIGYMHRPPQPLGHELPMFDPAMLDTQRQRAPFWRQPG
jgi:hypothetical protein